MDPGSAAGYVNSQCTVLQRKLVVGTSVSMLDSILKACPLVETIQFDDIPSAEEAIENICQMSDDRWRIWIEDNCTCKQLTMDSLIALEGIVSFLSLIENRFMTINYFGFLIDYVFIAVRIIPFLEWDSLDVVYDSLDALFKRLVPFFHLIERLDTFYHTILFLCESRASPHKLRIYLGSLDSLDMSGFYPELYDGLLDFLYQVLNHPICTVHLESNLVLNTTSRVVVTVLEEIYSRHQQIRSDILEQFVTMFDRYFDQMIAAQQSPSKHSVLQDNINLNMGVHVLSRLCFFGPNQHNDICLKLVKSFHSMSLGIITKEILLKLEEFVSAISLLVFVVKSIDTGVLLLEELFEHYFSALDKDDFLVFENATIEEEFYHMVLFNFCDIYKATFEGIKHDYDLEAKKERFLDSFYSKISMFSLIEEDFGPNSDYLRFLRIFVKFASIAHNQKLINRAYSLIMSRFRLERFDQWYPIYSPFVKQLVTSSNKKEDLKNICNLYAKLYLESDQESRKTIILDEFLSISALLHDNSTANPYSVDLVSTFFTFFVQFFLLVCGRQYNLVSVYPECVETTVVSLFHAMATVMEDASHVLDLDGYKETIYEIWNYLVCLSFSLGKEVLDRLENCCSRLVKCTPVLLGFSIVTKFDFDDSLASKIRDKLLESISFGPDIFTGCTKYEIIYYWILYTVQHTRYGKGLAPDLHLYLGHFVRDQRESVFRDIIFKICIKTLAKCIDHLEYLYIRDLIIHLTPLLLVLPQIRDFITFIVQVSPFIFVDELVLKHLFETIGTPSDGFFADDPTVQFASFHSTVGFVEKLLIDALDVAPTIMHCILCDFLQAFGHSSGLLFRLVLKCLSKYNRLPSKWEEFARHTDSFFTWIPSGPILDSHAMDKCFQDGMQKLEANSLFLGIYLVHAELRLGKVDCLLLFLQTMVKSWEVMVELYMESQYHDPFSHRHGVGGRPRKVPELVLHILSYLNERIAYDFLHFQTVDGLGRAFEQLFREFVHRFEHMKQTRTVAFQIINFGFRLIRGQEMVSENGDHTRKVIVELLASLFTHPAYYLNLDKRTMTIDLRVKQTCVSLIKEDLKRCRLRERRAGSVLSPSLTLENVSCSMSALFELFMYLIELEVWNAQCQQADFQDIFRPQAPIPDDRLGKTVQDIGLEYPEFVTSLVTYFPHLVSTVLEMFQSNPLRFIGCPELLVLMDPRSLDRFSTNHPEYFDKAHHVAPVSALSLMSRALDNSLLAKYVSKVLLGCDSDVMIFYIPQLVQLLRDDRNQIIRNVILELCRKNQIFTHQVIWNMQANILDETKELQDLFAHMKDEIIECLSRKNRVFCEREFGFFDNLLGISRTLKPMVRKSRAIKKAKIDEEMNKIAMDPGVYLPTDPDSIVVDVDYESGRPLQSHNKTPFMASFKVQLARDRNIVTRSVIFKVGDDCRQDMLTLQIISTFREIYRSVGLDLYLFPYRVVATGPGCGIIEVIPNSISRDQLGRERINGLYDYFVFKFGPEKTSSSFHRARMCFIKSLAAYSIASYLLAIRDRHNGNIMIDENGHIIHIDFGFILDMAPGGIKFERSPFKLTREMIRLMGDGPDTFYFGLFRDLCVQAYLALRPFSQKIVGLVSPLAKSNLPCFKAGQLAIQNFVERFRLDLSALEAKQHVCDLIFKSYDNTTTRIYDSFQYRTNSIPY